MVYRVQCYRDNKAGKGDIVEFAVLSKMLKGLSEMTLQKKKATVEFSAK